MKSSHNFSQSHQRIYLSAESPSSDSGKGNFLPIINDRPNQSYGGNQNWWLNIEGGKRKAQKGCGVVAACNFLAYLALKTNPGKYRKLLPDFLTSFPISQTAYLQFMEQMWPFIQMVPLIQGTTQLLMIHSLKKYAKRRGISWKAHYSQVGSKQEKVRNLIQTALSKDIPVLMLTNFLSGDIWEGYGSNHNMHVMTITEWFQNEDGKEFLAVSTWGKRHVVALSHFVKWGRVLGFNAFYLD